jgi:hypothetical protein
MKNKSPILDLLLGYTPASKTSLCASTFFRFGMISNLRAIAEMGVVT